MKSSYICLLENLRKMKISTSKATLPTFIENLEVCYEVSGLMA